MEEKTQASFVSSIVLKIISVTGHSIFKSASPRLRKKRLIGSYRVLANSLRSNKYFVF